MKDSFNTQNNSGVHHCNIQSFGCSAKSSCVCYTTSIYQISKKELYCFPTKNGSHSGGRTMYVQKAHSGKKASTAGSLTLCPRRRGAWELSSLCALASRKYLTWRIHIEDEQPPEGQSWRGRRTTGYRKLVGEVMHSYWACAIRRTLLSLSFAFHRSWSVELDADFFNCPWTYDSRSAKTIYPSTAIDS